MEAQGETAGAAVAKKGFSRPGSRSLCIPRGSSSRSARSGGWGPRCSSPTCTKPRFVSRGIAWYADTTREPVRDETIRQGLVPLGAVVEKPGVAVSSPLGRYALEQGFALLFDSALNESDLSAVILAWQRAHLSTAALARLAIVRAGAAKNQDEYVVTLPNDDQLRLSPGTSSVIAKAVIEQFAPRFLRNPAVLWLSESGNKVIARHDILAKQIGLDIDPQKHLPDIILVDLGAEGGPQNNLLIVFVEVVATDGAITAQRRAALVEIASSYEETQVAFVTAFLERGKPAVRKAFADLAWRSFVWLASEPRQLMGLFSPTIEQGIALQELVALGREPQD